MSTRVVLGRSGLEVSPVCFGTWQLSPRFWGPQPEADVRAAMRKAFDLGINFFDTADAYGDGYGESVLGAFLAEIPRREAVVATKVFNHYNPDGSRYPDLSPNHIIERCNASLKRLRVDAIDLYLLHFFDQLTPLEDVVGALEQLKRQGKILHYGTSNHSAEELRAQLRLGAYYVTQPPYSLVSTAIEKDLLPLCQAERVGVMVYSPMHKGLLTGKYRGTEAFEDFRRNHPDFQGERFQRITAAVCGLEPMAAKYGMTVYQLVLAATLMHPAIHVAVVGIKTPEQIAEAAGAMGRTLSREDYYALRAALNVDAPAKIKDASGKVK